MQDEIAHNSESICDNYDVSKSTTWSLKEFFCMCWTWGLTLNVAEQVGAHEGEDDHRYWQRTVWHHLPDFSMQEWAGKKPESRTWKTLPLLFKSHCDFFLTILNCFLRIKWYKLAILTFLSCNHVIKSELTNKCAIARKSAFWDINL